MSSSFLTRFGHWLSEDSPLDLALSPLGRDLTPGIDGNDSVVGLCAPTDTFPHPSEYREGLGSGTATAMYVCACVSAGILLAEFLVMLRLILQSVPRGHRKQTVWIHSVYAAIGTLTCFSVLMPR